MEQSEGNRLSGRFKFKIKTGKEKAESKFVLADQRKRKSISNVIDPDEFQKGIVDFIGIAGWRGESDDSVSSMFSLALSTSFKQIPHIITEIPVSHSKKQLPNKLEWFCFPNGLHLRRKLKRDCLLNVPLEIIAGMEYLIACFPYYTLFSKNGDMKEWRREEVINVLYQYRDLDTPMSKSSFINTEIIENSDLDAYEVKEALLEILRRRPPVFPKELYGEFYCIDYSNLKTIKKSIIYILAHMTKSSIYLLSYILSFIQAFVYSNNSVSLEYKEEDEGADSDLSDNEPVDVEEYYRSHSFKYHSLVSIPQECIEGHFEDICQCLFEVMFPTDSGLISQERKDQLYSAFVVMVIEQPVIIPTALRANRYVVDQGASQENLQVFLQDFNMNMTCDSPNSVSQSSVHTHQSANSRFSGHFVSSTSVEALNEESLDLSDPKKMNIFTPSAKHKRTPLFSNDNINISVSNSDDDLELTKTISSSSSSTAEPVHDNSPIVSTLMPEEPMLSTSENVPLIPSSLSINTGVNKESGQQTMKDYIEAPIPPNPSLYIPFYRLAGRIRTEGPDSEPMTEEKDHMSMSSDNPMISTINIYDCNDGEPANVKEDMDNLNLTDVGSTAETSDVEVKNDIEMNTIVIEDMSNLIHSPVLSMDRSDLGGVASFSSPTDNEDIEMMISDDDAQYSTTDSRPASSPFNSMLSIDTSPAIGLSALHLSALNTSTPSSNSSPKYVNSHVLLLPPGMDSSKETLPAISTKPEIPHPEECHIRSFDDLTNTLISKTSSSLRYRGNHHKGIQLTSTELQAIQELRTSTVFEDPVYYKLSYNILNDSTKPSYCCCLYYFTQHTIDYEGAENYCTDNSCVYIPSCLFLITSIPCPLQMCSILEDYMKVLLTGDTPLIHQITNFLLTDCQQPLFGKFGVGFQLNGNLYNMSIYHQGNRIIRMNKVNILFQLFSPQIIVKIVLLILLEEKIVFVSNRTSLLPMILEAFVEILPYAYMHPVIPVVPSYFLPILIDTPSPFLYGTSIEAYSAAKDSIPGSITIIWLGRESNIREVKIPAQPRRYLLHQIQQLNIHQPFQVLIPLLHHYFFVFLDQLLPNFTAYLFLLLGEICVFNRSLFMHNEIDKENYAFYEQFLNTVAFSSFVDHFWSPLLRFEANHFIQSNVKIETIAELHTISYPLFDFSYRIRGVDIKDIGTICYLPGVVKSSTSQLNLDMSVVINILGLKRSDMSIQYTTDKNDNVNEAFSHPIMKTINTVLSSLLLDKNSSYIEEQTDNVIEAFVEANVRSDFIRILYQPIEDMSPYKIITPHIAEYLFPLFNAFYMNCYNQDNFELALKLHIVTTTLIVVESTKYYPLYCYFKDCPIYQNTAFWMQFIMDYYSYASHRSILYSFRYHNTKLTSKQMNAATKVANFLRLERSSPAASMEQDSITTEEKNSRFDSFDLKNSLNDASVLDTAVTYIQELLNDMGVEKEKVSKIISNVALMVRGKHVSSPTGP